MFQHFDDLAAALAYLTSELTDSLRDDLMRMEETEREFYDDEDRATMAAKIADMEKIQPVVLKLPELINQLGVNTEALANVLLHGGKMTFQDIEARNQFVKDGRALLAEVVPEPDDEYLAVQQWADDIRPKFEGQVGDIVTDCDTPDNIDGCIRDMARDLALDAGCPEELIGLVVLILWPEGE